MLIWNLSPPSERADQTLPLETWYMYTHPNVSVWDCTRVNVGAVHPAAATSFTDNAFPSQLWAVMPIPMPTINAIMIENLRTMALLSDYPSNYRVVIHFTHEGDLKSAESSSRSRFEYIVDPTL
jgi:hypothetical protein